MKVAPVTTVDTTTVTAAPIMKRRHFGSFYIGLASGASVPSTITAKTARLDPCAG